MKINLIANLNGALMGLSFDAEHEITLGREIGNTISPLTADGLSRHHAKLYFKDGTWYVEDLGSTNGTYLMGAKIEGPKPLAAKNVLQCGNFKLTIDELGESAAPARRPPTCAAIEMPGVRLRSRFMPTNERHGRTAARPMPTTSRNVISAPARPKTPPDAPTHTTLGG